MIKSDVRWNITKKKKILTNFMHSLRDCLHKEHSRKSAEVEIPRN